MLGHMMQHVASAESMCRACPWRTMPDRTEHSDRDLQLCGVSEMPIVLYCCLIATGARP
jgi:hypothetical protein